MGDLLATPLYLLGALAGLLLGLALLVRRRAPRRSVLPGVDKLLAAGRYIEAGQLALKAERLEEAIDYFLRAQQPGRAAIIAVRAGRARQAAELFEQAGKPERAAHYYAQAGLADKARALGALAAPGAPRSLRAPSVPPVRTDSKRNITETVRTPPVPEIRVEEPTPDPAEETAEDPETLLAQGELAGAARAYARAGLFEEAVHLYVNVLACPGEAAPLCARLGRHERAAELFEQAGLKQEAAAAWGEHARGAEHPEAFVERMARLSDERALEFLAAETQRRPLSRETAELHYQYGEALRRRGQGERALHIYLEIRAKLGEYKDVAARVAEPAPAGPVAAAAPRPPAGEGCADLTPPRAAPALDVLDPEPGAPDQREVSARTAGNVTLSERVVRAARQGPPAAELERLIGGAPCTERNVALYYRLGVARLVAGRWHGALECFRAVEAAVPGYQDAAQRVAELEGWRHGLRERMSGVALEGAPGLRQRYAIEGELGRGGMAVVYRAVDRVLGRVVALKFLTDEAGREAQIRQLFEREARAAAKLNHKNVVTIYDFGTLDGRPFIAMEYVEGVTLKERIAEVGQLSSSEALRVTAQLLAALGYAHARNIVHRDVKPSNLMVDASGTVKLMDFGVAKTVAQDSRASIVAGTPAYMAPEQLLGEGIDARADLFAVGVTLYEMLTGTLPFERWDRVRRPVPLRVLAPAVPAVVEEIVERALALESNDRWQSAESFASTVENILAAVDKHTGDLRASSLPRLDFVPKLALTLAVPVASESSPGVLLGA